MFPHKLGEAAPDRHSPHPGSRARAPTRGRGWREAWPTSGTLPAPLPPPSPLPLPGPQVRAREVMSGVATRFLSTDHTFLAEESEEGLVLLWGEQQGPHVGDPPRRRRLLLDGAHGFAGRVGRPGPGGQGRLLRRVGESSFPLSVTGAGRSGVRGATSRSSSGAGRRRRSRDADADGEPPSGRAEKGKLRAPARPG